MYVYNHSYLKLTFLIIIYLSIYMYIHLEVSLGFLDADPRASLGFLGTLIANPRFSQGFSSSLGASQGLPKVFW